MGIFRCLIFCSAIDVRLNSLQYTTLRDRLMSPIRTARDVVIHQSLGDRFAAAFAEQVERNGVYRVPSDGPVSGFCYVLTAKFERSINFVAISFLA